MASANISDFKEIVRDIDNKKILLPYFQRDFVWKDEERQKKIVDRALFFFQTRCGIRYISEINYNLMLVLVGTIFMEDSYFFNYEVHKLLEAWYWSVVFSGEYDKDQNSHMISNLQNIIKRISERFNDYKLFRPSDEEILDLQNYVSNIMDAFAEKISSVNAYITCENDNPAIEYRNSKGGNIIFRPMVIVEFFKVAVIIKEKRECSFAEAFSCLNVVPLDLSEKPWSGFLWDGTRIVSGASHTIIRYLLMYMVDDELLNIDEKKKLFVEYAKIQKITENESKVLLKSII